MGGNEGLVSLSEPPVILSENIVINDRLQPKASEDILNGSFHMIVFG